MVKVLRNVIGETLLLSYLPTTYPWKITDTNGLHLKPSVVVVFLLVGMIGFDAGCRRVVNQHSQVDCDAWSQIMNRRGSLLFIVAMIFANTLVLGSKILRDNIQGISEYWSLQSC